jgi:hypothetical protein
MPFDSWAESFETSRSSKYIQVHLSSYWA